MRRLAAGHKAMHWKHPRGGLFKVKNEALERRLSSITGQDHPTPGPHGE